MGLTVAALKRSRVGWGMAVALHTIRATRGSNGEAGEVPALSFMKGMSLCPRLSHGKPGSRGKALN